MAESRMLIFVVDDDPSVRKALKRLLCSAGFKVESFGSAEELLSSGRPERPDLFILDVRMPGLSGFDLQRELLAAGSHAPVIFITAYEDARGRAAAMAAGAAAFLQKPIDDEILLGAIRAALSRKDSERPPPSE